MVSPLETCLFSVSITPYNKTIFINSRIPENIPKDKDMPIITASFEAMNFFRDTER